MFPAINLSFFAKRWKIGGMREDGGGIIVGGGRREIGGEGEREVGGEKEGGMSEGGGEVRVGGVSGGRWESVKEEIIRRRESIRVEGFRRDSVKEVGVKMEGGMVEREEESRRTAGRLMEKGMGVRELVEKRVEIEKLTETL